MSACMSGTRGSGVLSSTGDVLVASSVGAHCVNRGCVALTLIFVNKYLHIEFGNPEMKRDTHY